MNSIEAGTLSEGSPCRWFRTFAISGRTRIRPSFASTPSHDSFSTSIQKATCLSSELMFGLIAIGCAQAARPTAYDQGIRPVAQNGEMTRGDATTSLPPKRRRLHSDPPERQALTLGARGCSPGAKWQPLRDTWRPLQKPGSNRMRCIIRMNLSPSANDREPPLANIPVRAAGHNTDTALGTPITGQVAPVCLRKWKLPQTPDRRKKTNCAQRM